MEMLNRSDTPETRALLSQAGIQISDEIGDSEEEEVMEVKADDTDFEEEVRSGALVLYAVSSTG